MHPHLPLLLATILLAVVPRAGAGQAADPILDTLTAELGRARTSLASTAPPPYYLACQVTDTRSVSLKAEEGGLQGTSPQRVRILDVDVRVGEPRLDSTHALRGGGSDTTGAGGRALLLTDEPPLLAQGIWRETDRRFLAAQERWARVQSDRQVLVDEEPSWDLAPTEPEQALDPVVDWDLDLPTWEDRLRRASAVLAGSRVSYDGGVQYGAEATTSWFVNSEGTRIRTSGVRHTVSIAVDTVADDGARLELYRSWSARRHQDLPDLDTLTSEVRALDDLLTRLQAAPLQDPYSGPVILSDRASAVFFHEILGHRLEGERLKQVDDAQTLKDLVGQPILPAFLSVVDDPTLGDWNGRDLNGTYRYDNEGVRAQRVTLIEDGILRGFLQSRSPTREGDRSNGHGRRQPGYDATSRQGNLLVLARESVPDTELRKELLRLAKEAGLEYGLYVEDIRGGFTLTGRRIPNAFTVDVQVAWRVWVDGRPDELVRGLDLIGTPLVTLGRIVRAGEVHDVFNGVCGAESGGVPVSAVSPSLLISLVETQRKTRSQMTPNLLPPPTPGGAP